MDKRNNKTFFPELIKMFCALLIVYQKGYAIPRIK